jgi:Brp/Blh family beta-carotene 15,15'-monooxygenase
MALLHLAGDPLFNGLALSLAAGLMLLGGLPHGAFDIALAREALRLNNAAAAALLLAYVTVAGLMLALWWWSPLVALGLFLLLSAVHFGEDWQMIESGLLRAMAGASILCVPAFFHPDVVDGIFVLMAGEGAEWIRRIVVATTPVALLVTFVGMWQSVKSGNLGWAMSQLAALAGLAVLHPQYGFLLYFVFLHSPLHMRSLGHDLAHWSDTRFWIYGGLICLLCAALISVVAPAFYSGDAPLMTAEGFRILSIVAAPHLLLTLFVAEFRSKFPSRAEVAGEMFQ